MLSSIDLRENLQYLVAHWPLMACIAFSFASAGWLVSARIGHPRTARVVYSLAVVGCVLAYFGLGSRYDSFLHRETYWYLVGAGAALWLPSSLMVPPRLWKTRSKPARRCGVCGGDLPATRGRCLKCGNAPEQIEKISN